MLYSITVAWEVCSCEVKICVPSIWCDVGKWWNECSVLGRRTFGGFEHNAAWLRWPRCKESVVNYRPISHCCVKASWECELWRSWCWCFQNFGLVPQQQSWRAFSVWRQKFEIGKIDEEDELQCHGSHWYVCAFKVSSSPFARMSGFKLDAKYPVIAYSRSLVRQL